MGVFRFVMTPAMLVLLLAGCTVLPYSNHLYPTPGCATDKIRFTQDTGCLNDGSVEFCLPADDPGALDSVHALVDENSVKGRCMQARGRAGCDLESEVLCRVETAGLCVERHGALTDTGWALIYDLAALESVREIGPTWYE